MSVQLSYSKETANALAGLVSDISPYDIESFTNETGVIAFGLGVQFGSSANEAVLGSGASGANFIGIATRYTAKENTVVGGEEEQYNEKDIMAVIRKGNVWVTLAAGGAPGDPVHVVDATGVIDAGAPGAGQTLIGSLQTTAAAGALGLLRLDFDHA